jgi:UDPglucose 6-dehydrogenase
MIKKIKIGFVGLTHLGLNYLAASAQKKFSVMGIDTSNKKVIKLNKNIIEYKEPNLKKIILKNKKNITFTHNFKNLKKCNLVFISQDVKTNTSGKSDLKNLRILINKTIKHLNKNAILVVLSQIKPGFMRTINIGHRKLYHQVETLIFGKAFSRALNPERIIVGCINKFNEISPIYLRYLNSFKCPVLKMEYESAEIAKISINLLLASSVTTTNILSELCEKMSADWNDIVPALKLDKRIGKFAYIKPGLGISGGNIERDIVTVKSMLNKESPPSLLLKNMLENSQYMKHWLNRILTKEKTLVKKDKINIGIVGAAYKENTNSIKNSPIIDLLNYLKDKKNISIYEPMLNLELKNKNIKQVHDLKKLVNKNEIIIFMRPWINKKEIQNVYKNLKNKLVIDPYRVINFKDQKNILNKYFTLGTN